MADSPRSWILPFLVIVTGSVALALLNQPEFTGDPAIYRSRMELLFNGEVPYLDFYYEHLPLSLVPMALAWLLGGFVGDVVYTSLFALLMLLCLWIVADRTTSLGVHQARSDAVMSWLWIAGPLFPIVLFRSDPFPTVLAVGALTAIVAGYERASIGLEFAGVLAKGWPGVLALVEWRRGRRLRAVVVAAAAALLLGGLLLLPGFREGRAFSGLHSETIVGAATIAARTATGAPLELLYEAGATYVSVPSWAWFANLGIGVVVAFLALLRFRGSFSLDQSVRVLAASIVALLLVTPTLSPQFLLWPTAFLALHSSRVVRGWSIVVMALTLIYMIGWNPDFEGNPWWIYLLNVRNVALVGLGLVCAWETMPAEPHPIARESFA